MGTPLREHSEDYLMNANMTGFKYFSKKYLHPCVLDESSQNIVLPTYLPYFFLGLSLIYVKSPISVEMYKVALILRYWYL